MRALTLDFFHVTLVLFVSLSVFELVRPQSVLLHLRLSVVFLFVLILALWNVYSAKS